MRRIVLLTVVVWAVAAFFAATSHARPIINGNRYIETDLHECNLATPDHSCIATFTRIPAGKVLTILNVSCQIDVGNNVRLSRSYLKVSDFGGIPTQVAIMLQPISINPSSSTVQGNNQIFAFAKAGYTPTLRTDWSGDVDAEMTCTIAGQLDPAN